MVVKGEIVEECDSTMCREALMLGRGSQNSGVNAFAALGRAREGRWGKIMFEHIYYVLLCATSTTVSLSTDKAFQLIPLLQEVLLYYRQLPQCFLQPTEWQLNRRDVLNGRDTK